MQHLYCSCTWDGYRPALSAVKPGGTRKAGLALACCRCFHASMLILAGAPVRWMSISPDPCSLGIITPRHAPALATQLVYHPAGLGTASWYGGGLQQMARMVENVYGNDTRCMALSWLVSYSICASFSRAVVNSGVGWVQAQLAGAMQRCRGAAAETSLRPPQT